jgi:hypothetical protein
MCWIHAHLSTVFIFSVIFLLQHPNNIVLLTLPMPGRAKSLAEKAAVMRRQHDDLMSRALQAYLTELKNPNHHARRGLRKICRDFENLYFNETGVKISLSHATLARLSDGGHTRMEAQEHRRWLTNIEEDVVVDFLLEMGQLGWPENHRRIREHVNLIANARLGQKFPNEGVGKNWTARFMQRHSDRIKMVDSRPLERLRAQAANPNANGCYWDLLRNTITKYKIRPETTFGADEAGFQSRGQECEHVAASRTQKGPQYQQKAGTRENTTIIVTICADGTSTPPTVIFKGSAYQVSWGENNPLNAL